MRQVPQPPNWHSCGRAISPRSAASSTASPAATSKDWPVSSQTTRWFMLDSVEDNRGLFLDVGLDHDLVAAGGQRVFQRLQGGQATRGVLLAIATAQAHAAHHFAVDDDGEATDEDGELAFKAPLDAEGLVARQGRAVGRGVEEVR